MSNHASSERNYLPSSERNDLPASERNDLPSSERNDLHIIKASAGSGKTHRLTGEYLHLLFSGQQNYRHILAVTFTNKATGEMKSRIVNELHRLASGDDSAYLQELMHDFPMKEQAVRSQAKTILESILHDYSAFSISTIDRFFQQTMRAFTREMGLSGGYNIELDESSYLMETVELMLSELEQPENKMLADWLLLFMQHNIEEGKSWKINSQVLDLAKQLFNETYKSFSDEEQATIQDKEQLEAYRQMLIRIVKSYEQQIKAVGVEAVTIMEHLGLAYDDFKYKNKSGFGLFPKLAKGEVVKPSDRLRKLADNIDLWFSGKEKESAIRAAYSAGLNDCVNEIILYSDNDSSYQTARHLLRNFYTLGILNDIKQRLRKLQQENNTLFLSDTTELLNRLIAGTDSPFIYEKTGTRITNYMIDEFQDTSLMQWNNFKPLIGESLSSGNFNLIVGDVKQSIFRFRNSDWRLLEKQVADDFHPKQIKEHVLDTNWRSDTHIVQFNNSFFSQAATVLQNDFNARTDDSNTETEKLADTQITDAYRDVYQQVPSTKAESGGQVKISFLKNGKEKEIGTETETETKAANKAEIKAGAETETETETVSAKTPQEETEKEADWKTKVLDRLPHEIEQLQDQGFAPKDIAVVVRWNYEAVEVANALLSYKKSHPSSPYKFDIISNEALLIGSAQSVKAIIALMRHFRNPNDETHRMMATYEYFRYHRQVTPEEALRLYWESSATDLSDEATQLSNDAARAKFRRRADISDEATQYLNELASLPLYDMIERFFALSADALNERENAYVQAFLDLALKFSTRTSGDLGAFLDWWDEEGCKKALFSPEDQDAIRLITIHKSKGLGFGAVIMPFVNWKVDHDPNHHDIIWCKPQVAPFNQMSVLPLRYGKTLADTIFKKEYLDEKRFTYIDNLNLLYVAFTRAKHRLILFVPKPDKPEPITTVADLLWRSISDSPTLSDDGKEYITLSEHLTEDESAFRFTFGLPSPHRGEDKPGPPSEKTGKWRSVPFGNRLKLRLNAIGFFSDDGRRDYGKMMHDIVSNVHTLADIPQAVERKISEGELPASDRESTINELTGFLSLPEIRYWYSDQYTILNEAQVLHPHMGLSRPDRVMIGKDEVIVADYKFGDLEDPRYIRQVQRYVKSIEEMGFKHVKGFVFYVKLGKVVQV